MKNFRYIWFLCLAIALPFFVACNEDDEVGSQSEPMNIVQVYLEDADATVTDRKVDFARLGQVIRIEGSGFLGLKKLYINGHETYFNNALVTNNNIWVTLDSKTPVAEADPEYRNTIRLKKDETECIYEFIIRAASPQIKSVNNTLPAAGEKVTVFGSNLQETTKITLPGGVEVTSGIESDEDGEWYSFIMPEGVTEGGSILSEGANGTAKTPAFFNEKRGMILDFDGTGVQGGWSATYMPEDLTTDPLNSGRGNVVPAVPASVLAEAGIQGGAHGKGWFTAGGEKGSWSDPTENWTRFYDLIPAETPVENIALQFDVYVPEEWSTGMLEFTLQNNLSNYGYGSTETTNTTNIEYPMAVVWVPWLTEDGQKVPYKTEGWTTITIPVSSIGKYQNAEAGHTFATVCADRAAASYANFGMFLVNTDVEYSETVLFEATEFNQEVYVDNWRLVPYESFVISDFPDEE